MEHPSIMKVFPVIFFICWGFASCGHNSPMEETRAPQNPEGNVDAESERGAYADKFDPILDVGQYTFPEMEVKPQKYWSCVGALTPDRNDLGKINENEGLQYHLLCQSISGLTNRAVDEGKSQIGVWLYDQENRNSYKISLNALQNMGIEEQGMQTGIELARNNYDPAGGINIQIKNLFDGYVLTDVEQNPESAIVASVASQVYNSIIVDIRDKSKYDEAGYVMKYDARTKTTRQSWDEFKDKCSNKALVVMPVQTAELRDFAIKNNFFVLNINRLYGNPNAGQNLDVFEEVLKWLEPGAPIFGWEQGVSEDVFVDRASKTGHVWIPSDWMYNIPMSSLQYKSRQQSILAKVMDPHSIDFTKKKNFVSFYLTDGDNLQWMMNNFVEDFYSDENADAMHMGFGLPVGNLAMVSPPYFNYVIDKQKDSFTIVESLGGGYSYTDDYDIDNNREEGLSLLARSVAAHMRQHRVKILGLMAHNVLSDEAKKGYQAFVDANDQLEGIVAVQYAPYSGGKGSILWVTNKNGFDIPVITIKYSLWNFGNSNAERDGTPAFVANKLKSEAKDLSFSLVAVHAWSSFKDVGLTNDELVENQDGDKKGASAAKLCVNHLDTRFEIVNIQELVWRIRMQYRETQTKQYLDVVD